MLKGEAAGVKQQGGILEQILREVEIECLPADIPASIEADVSELVFGKVLRVSDLPHDEKLKFFTDRISRWLTSSRLRKKWWRRRKRSLPKLERLRRSPKSSRRASRKAGEEGAEPAAEKAEKPRRRRRNRIVHTESQRHRGRLRLRMKKWA